MSKIPKFDTPWDSDYWMESNGFFCGFNMPKAVESLKNTNNEEVQHALPEYRWRRSFLVDEYPACPETWMRSEGKLSSYFVPIVEGEGMWLDFNKNQKHTHHLAVVVSIQGVNALTGLACENPNLEQYIETCPKHNKKFGPNRFCEECGFKWPKQNYLCTTATPNGYFWLDGFRAANGAVCQYILTEKTMKGVASNIIGNKRVYAIGISFFLSKDVRKIPAIPDAGWVQCASLFSSSSSSSSSSYGSSSSSSGWQNRVSDWFDEAQPDMDCLDMGAYRSREVEDDEPITQQQLDSSVGLTKGIITSDETPKEVNYNCSTGKDSLEVTQNQIKSYAKDSRATCKTISRQGAVPHVTPVRTKSIEIGAGASIRQDVYDDPEPLDFWRDQPESILTINYCLEEEAGKIIARGKVSKAGDPMGFLKDVPTGNEKVAEGVCK